MKNNIVTVVFLLVMHTAQAQPAVQPTPGRPTTQGQFRELFAGPAEGVSRITWLDSLKAWRISEKQKIGYNDRHYTRPGSEWVKQTFVFAQMMSHDRYFYDPVKGVYTVDRYLDDLIKRYGGLDGVLVWPTYPNIGVDNRNQLDLLAGMPGGINGVKKMIADFHRRGVKVFFPIMVWDNGTRKLDHSMAVALVKMMKEIGADGLNGDTMSGVSEDYANAADSLGFSLSFQPELSIRNIKGVEWNDLSWGYFWPYQKKPGVSVYKWMESRHQVNITNRWAVDKTDDLQYALFNGIGINTWENIWGIWNNYSDRYAEAVRRISTIYRTFPDNWSDPDWEPYVPTLQAGVYASEFTGQKGTIYTFINRDSIEKKGGQISLPVRKGARYFDLWSAQEIKAVTGNGVATLSFLIEQNGYGAVFVTESADEKLLQKIVRSKPKPLLQTIPVEWKPLKQEIVAIAPTKKISKAPEGMVAVPAAENYQFESIGVMIEGKELPTALGIQHPWEEHPDRSQKHVMSIPAFYMDRFPVTNAQYFSFVKATGYHPKDDHNFLKDWVNGAYPKGWEDKPVTWVSLEDARAYAAWAGKRLPHEWEWQYAAQGIDGRLYPWGEKDTTRMPLQDHNLTMRAPGSVHDFPQGASPFGVEDMVGNIWQWTDEYRDEHTRAAVLKGTGYFRALGSRWYFPPAYELNKYVKYLLMSPGLDRSGTIGFRCAADH
ncbi:MAG: hypothetical protein JWQ78_451 [Sediminibacterium sp.]|nr:hypothetical protein [Sediminibacterium sp.]